MENGNIPAKRKKKDKKRDNKKSSEIKMALFAVLVIAVFAALVMRLFELQVLSDDRYVTQSDKNRTRILSISSKRGNIYDANGVELATSKPVFAIALLGVQPEDRDTVANNLARILQDESISPELIKQTLIKHSKRYEPVVIKRVLYDDAGVALISQIQENRVDLPGVLIMEEPMRYYPQGSLAGHILGTVGLIGSGEQNLMNDYDFLITDWVGKTGVEKAMEIFEYKGVQIGLHGANGVQYVEIDAKNYPLRTISTVEPVPGNSLVLTIDSDVQRVLEQSLANTIAELQKTYPKCQVGSAVLLDVHTGAVIAAASYPGMDPNDFVNGLSQEMYSYYYTDMNRPMFNRFIAGTYPPGSTFKMTTALAALASGAVLSSDRVTCNASMWVSPRSKCSYAHGSVNLEQALTVSCNTYFQEIGYRTGVDALYSMGAALGFGTKTGIELVGEAAGVLPNPAWKLAHNKPGDWEYKWHDYDTFYMSMGQGLTNFTPLQMANYVATIANGGNHMQVHIVKQILSPDGSEVIYNTEPVLLNSLPITDADLALVRTAMRKVVTGGTAESIFRGFPVAVAAKTGTAQTGRVGDDSMKDFHGTFVAYAPADDPQVAFACVIEYGDSGGKSGGLVCRDVFREYFGLNEYYIPDDLPEIYE